MSSTTALDFEDWYRAEHAGLVTLLSAVLGDADEGRDIVDEALARAYERWATVSTMVSPVGWTYRVALNLARRRGRRRALEAQVLRRSRPQSVPGPTGELWMLVASLPVRQREAVLLRHVAQLTEREIADVMGVKRGTVSSTLRSAYQRLGIAIDDSKSREQSMGLEGTRSTNSQDAPSHRPSPPPPVEAIRERAARHRRRRAATRVSVLAFSAGLVVSLVAVVVTGGEADRPRVSVGDSTSSPVQSADSPSVPVSCVVTAQNDPGCDMSPSDAAVYLGFEARVPDIVPAGWVVERKKLRVFRHPESDGVELFDTFPAAVEIPVYNQIWTPPGEDLESQSGCPSRLQIRQRPASPGETGGGDAHSIDLDGHQLFGSELAAPSSCEGTTVASTTVFWIEDGIAFNVNAYNVDRATIERVIESVFRH